MSAARLPEPGKDSGVWGQVLNDYLSTSHDTTGALKPGIVTGTTIADGSITNAKIATNAAISQTKVSGLTDLQTQVNAFPNITISATAPTGPSVNDIWIDVS